MRIITPDLSGRINIGRVGESGTTRVDIPVEGWDEMYGAGTFSLLVQRPGESTAYPVAITTIDDILSWVVTGTETAVAGYGRAELLYTVPGGVAKSEIFITCCGEALEQGDAPIQPITITSNGVTTAPSGKGYSPITVNVVGTVLQDKTINPSEYSQVVSADEGYYGLNEVTVTPIQTETKSTTLNGTVTPSSGKYLTSVSVNVPQAIPIEISTDAGMTAVLTAENVGKAYLFTGTTGTYTNGNIYIVQEV